MEFTLKVSNINFFRDAKGHEVDIIYMLGNYSFPLEIKAGESFRSNFLKQLFYFNNLFKSEEKESSGALVYNGNSNYHRNGFEILNYLGINDLLEKLDN